MLTTEVIFMKKNNNKFKDLLKKRGFYISLMAGAICVVAFTALYMNSNGEPDSRGLKIDESSEVADNGEGHTRVTEIGIDDQTATASPQNEAGKNGAGKTDDDKTGGVNTAAGKKTAGDKTGDDKKKSAGNETDDDKKTSDDKKTGNKTDDINKTGSDKTDNKKKSADKTDEARVAVMESGKGVSNLSFNQEKGIMWPVNGEIIMNYSPDSVVYYKSLGAYKTNPAVVIAAAEGSNVCSGTDAVVTDIGENEEIGKYVITSIGDGYKIIYGQLDNIQVKQSAKLKEGEIIGTIAAPTKYYIEEGSNLYLKMMCESQPVDPLIFLR